MTSMKLLGVALAAATMITGSAMAQTVGASPGRCVGANCQNVGPGNTYSGHRYRHHRMSYRQTNGDWNRTHTGFWPTDVAGDVAGAAIGTAGAIATAPFRAMDNSYAYDNRGWDTRTYAQRNGFVCTPGTLFKGDDGRQHRCQ